MINLKKQFGIADLRKFVKNEGKFFSVVFEKKDGSTRKMVVRFGVTCSLTGGGAKYDAEARNMIVVFSMFDYGYRTIAVDKIKRIKAYGKVLNLQD